MLCLLCLCHVEDIKLGFRNSKYTFSTPIPTCTHGYIMFRIWFLPKNPWNTLKRLTFSPLRSKEFRRCSVVLEGKEMEPWILCLCLFHIEDIKQKFQNFFYTSSTSIQTYMHGFIMFGKILMPWKYPKTILKRLWLFLSSQTKGPQRRVIDHRSWGKTKVEKWNHGCFVFLLSHPWWC